MVFNETKDRIVQNLEQSLQYIREAKNSDQLDIRLSGMHEMLNQQCIFFNQWDAYMKFKEKYDKNSEEL